MPKKSVPDGWFPITAVGKPVTGTRFLPFKVPLKDTVCHNLEPDERFTPSILLENEPNLRLVIDLTNTYRYYDCNEFQEKGVKHVKILCPGREIPAKKLMKQFFDAVDDFMKNVDNEDKFIGVHCTHGINRTGFFICTYMIQKLEFTPEEAIIAFQKARGHEIVREYFIDQLKRDPNDKSQAPIKITPFEHYTPRKSKRQAHKPSTRGAQKDPPVPQGSHSKAQKPSKRGVQKDPPGPQGSHSQAHKPGKRWIHEGTPGFQGSHFQAHKPTKRGFHEGPPGPQGYNSQGYNSQKLSKFGASKGPPGFQGPHSRPIFRGPHTNSHPPPGQSNPSRDPFYRQRQLNGEEQAGYDNLPRNKRWQ